MFISWVILAAGLALLIQTTLCLQCARPLCKWIPLLVCGSFTNLCFLIGLLCRDLWTAAGFCFWLLGVYSLLPLAACGLGLLAFFSKKRQNPHTQS